MAIAGKVAITSGGEWSESTAYNKLVLVTYNNDLYLSKKSNTGVAPTDEETWQLLIKNVTQEQYDNIINGTTQVGDTKKLGGKSASEYLNKTEGGTVGDGSDYAPLKIKGIANYSLIPFLDNNDNVFGYIGMKNDKPMFSTDLLKDYILATTADLANYLPKSGGDLNKGQSIVFNLRDSGQNAILNYFKNADGSVFGGIGALGSDGVGQYLSLAVSADPYASSDGLTIYRNAIKWKNQDLLHTGNKPSGSYTGNGSETERTIAIGGNGNGVLIFGSNGTTALVAEGAICGNGSSVSGVQHGQARLTTTKDITMKLVTNHPALNESGVIYYFAVL